MKEDSGRWKTNQKIRDGIERKNNTRKVTRVNKETIERNKKDGAHEKEQKLNKRMENKIVDSDRPEKENTRKVKRMHMMSRKGTRKRRQTRSNKHDIIEDERT